MTLGKILITGGSSGLGAAVVSAVADAGGRPVVLDRTEPPREVAERAAAFRRVDVAETRDAESEIRELIGEMDGIDGVVTAAGIDRCGTLLDVDGAEWERVIRVNLLGAAAVIRAALPSLIERQGRIVTVASTLGWRALSDASAYCASKFGVVGLTRALMAELAGRVGVTLLLPGGMDTHFFDDRPAQYRPGPEAKLNRPEHVAASVVFALSQPPGCDVRELMVTPSMETSWP